MLKISQAFPYLNEESTGFITSGATYPGVPHRQKMKGSLISVASPKSAITTESNYPGSRKSIFSSLRSRCIRFILCIDSIPPKIPNKIFCISS